MFGFGNLFGGSGGKSLGDQIEEFAIKELASKALPKIKKFLPKIESGIKEFFSKNECVVIVKQQKNGDLVCAIAKAELCSITMKDGAIVKDDTGRDMIYSANEFIEMFTKGAFEKMLGDVKTEAEEESEKEEQKSI